MGPRDEKVNRKLFIAAIKKLLPQGWIPVGMWLFEKGGIVFDLGAADIAQHERIYRERLFVVNGS